MNYKAAMMGLLLAVTAQAAEYNQLQPAQSALTFGYKQMGVAMDGKFNKFSAQISFDPARLENARAKIDVYLASIDTGSTDADMEVAGKLWFDAKNYPLASFVSTGIRRLAGNRYQASGKLTIKGRTLEVTAPVTFHPDGSKGVFDGSFNIRRSNYAIGIGEWADLSTVADDIQIVFHLVVNTASPIQPSRKKP